MLFNYELKKIWRRISPLAILIIILLTSVLTTALTYFLFNKVPDTVPDSTINTEYKTLADKISKWNTTVNRNEFADAFDDFYTDYKAMNGSTFDGNNLVVNYNTAKTSFNNFYLEYYQKYINASTSEIVNYLLIKEQNVNKLDEILSSLDAFFGEDYTQEKDIIQGLKNTNTAWDDANLQTVLNDLFYVQVIDNKSLTDLQVFLAKYPAGQSDYDYTDAYDYLLNRYWIAIANSSEYSGDLSQYLGFKNFQNITNSTQTYKLAGYQLEHSDQNFTTPFAFCKIYGQGNQISLFDFIFTNLEMASFIIIILTMIWSGCAFFTDTYQKTLVTPIAIGKKRSTIIIVKMLAVLVLAVASILILTGIYATCGLLFFKASIGPDILFLFNGSTPTVMSSANYFVIYFLSLIFKLLPLIALCGLFSFIKIKPFVSIGLTLLIYSIAIMLNYFLSGFAFYQFVPLLALDPISYLGADLLLSTMPNTYNLWYTFPAMFIIIGALYWLVIYKFRRHDFY